MAGIGKMETLGDLQRFKESMSANVDELQSYEGTRLQFEALVVKALSLTQQQAALTAAKQDASKQLKTVLIEAQRLATVLRFAVKAHYGPLSEKLVEFGVQPFRGRTRKQKPETPPELKAPAPAETSPVE